jgi:hypothetical protein
MRKQDRKGSTDARQLIVLPAVGARVVVAGRGPGVVTERGFSSCEIRLDSGCTERVDATQILPLS